MVVDYVVVGSGLTGATVARVLTDLGKEVVVLERRSHVGGNVHDSVHESGIRFHTYGPHYFRTGSEKIWRFVTRFASFVKFEAELQTFVDNKYFRWPVHEMDLRHITGGDWTPGFIDSPSNFEEASLAFMPHSIYERFVKGYTEKQWGVPAVTLEKELARRFDVRFDGDGRLSRHPYQGLPSNGYNEWMRQILSGIPVMIGTDYLAAKTEVRFKRALIYTGPIDEFFGYSLGRLRYRGQKRVTTYYSDIQHKQPGVQVNYPGIEYGAKIRTIEWKYLLPEAQRSLVRGTLTTDEIPSDQEDPNNFEYPFPDQKNQFLYREYRRRADALPRTLICGRLGEYRYFDMDQAIGRAFSLLPKLLRF